MKTNEDFSPYGDKLNTFKKLLYDYICKSIEGASDLPYMKDDPMYTTMLEVLACSLDQIRMQDMPISLSPDSIPQDICTFRLNYLKRNARKKWEEEQKAAYPEGYSQEVKRANPEKLTAQQTKAVPDKTIKEYEETIRQLEERLSSQISFCEKWEKDCVYWKEAYKSVLQHEAAKNQLQVSKKYKLDKLTKVEFLNNLIATEPYSSEQLNYIQHCLLQDIPIKLLSKCFSAALPVSFMEDYVRYSCRRGGVEYREYDPR